MLTLAEVLELPVLQAGHPTVLSGADALDTEIAWVHVSELPDVGSLLRGGELVLSTGLFLASASPAEVADFPRRLRAAGAAGLILELGRSFRTAPSALVQAARRSGLPLVTLSRTVRFVEVTQAVHTRIINAQHASLRFAQRVHEVFTEVTLSQPRVQDVLDRTAEIAGAPVVLEDLTHRVLGVAAGGRPLTTVLARWPQRSRAVSAWVTADVGPLGRRTGRLVLPEPGELDPESAQVLIDRAAQTLTVTAMLGGAVVPDRPVHRSQVSTDLIADLLTGRAPGTWRIRAEAAGLTSPATLIPWVLAVVDPDSSGTGPPVPADGTPGAAGPRIWAGRTGTGHGGEQPAGVPPWPAAGPGLMMDEIIAAATDLGVPAIAAAVPEASGTHGLPAVAVLLAVRDGAGSERVQEQLRTALLRRTGQDPAGDEALELAGSHWTIATGRACIDVAAAAEVLRHTVTAARVAATLPPARQRRVHRAADLRTRALVHDLRDDPRLVSFAESMLAPLLAVDGRATRGGRLVEVLTTFCEAGGNKTVLARRTHLSRPTLYAKLSRIEQLLDVDLDDAETRLGLHLALLARQGRGD